MRPATPRSPRAALLLLALLALLATACGDGSEPATITAPVPLADDGEADAGAPATPGDGVAAAGTVDPDAAQAAADANIGGLQGSDDVRLIEVLNVADGSVATLSDAVVGDRPVLLWFWAPH